MNAPVSLEVLRSFCDGAPEAWMRDVLWLWSPATLERATDESLRKSLGEDYEHVNWKTAVCDGQVMLCIPCWKCPGGKEPAGGYGFPARWLWCFDQIRTETHVREATEVEVDGVPEEVRERLAVLEEVRWWVVEKLVFTRHGSRGKPKLMSEPAPDGVLPFSFKGGYGMAVKK